MRTNVSPIDVAGQVSNAGVHAASVRRSDYRILRDFRAFEIVNALRLPLTLDGFRALATFGSIALMVLGTMVFASTLSVLREGPLRDDTTAVLNGGFLAILYSAVATVLTEVVSSRRLAVSGAPHLDLFRALELPLRQVVVRYGLIPALRRTGLLWYSAAVFLMVLFEETSSYLSIVVASVSVLALASCACVYCVLHFASTPARRIGLRWLYCFLALTLGLLLGAATGFLVPRFSGLGGFAEDPARFLPVLCLLAAVGSGVLILLSIRAWLRLSYRKISLGAERGGKQGARTSFGLFVVMDLLSSKQGSVITTIVLAWITIVGILLGARGVLPLHSALSGGDLQKSLIGIAVLVSLGITEPMLNRIGPTAKLYHYRFAWENGFPATAIIVRLVGIYIMAGAAIGGFVFLGALLALEIPVPGAVFAGMIVAASGVVAESLSRPPTTTDGTKSNDVMDALVTLLLISPCSLVLVVSPEFSTVLLLGYSILLTLGAAVCLRQRLLRLQSNLIP
ncbi:hypothetical protein [Arthrobacter bambusae]|uniref:hypothetical protein n=1 Tax=Arthrobacter bambusae TaxID=1338426 RepID=UPI00278039C6|nr:hypothetical protein [Arthrobacter bambusae]MDQ0029700.1 hypothetical protein [Arthrobacter bambusae]MDQ0097361.1 hypothetical protein [Arthrobacter bambusae]